MLFHVNFKARGHDCRHCVQVTKKVSQEKFPSTAKYSDRSRSEDASHTVSLDTEFRAISNPDEVVAPEDKVKAYKVRPLVAYSKPSRCASHIQSLYVHKTVLYRFDVLRTHRLISFHGNIPCYCRLWEANMNCRSSSMLHMYLVGLMHPGHGLKVPVWQTKLSGRHRFAKLKLRNDLSEASTC